MVTAKQGKENLADIAYQKFVLECERRESGHPPLGIFSEIREGIGIGKWGHGTIIFDTKEGFLYGVYVRSPGTIVVYRASLPRGRYGEGKEALGEFLFGGSSMEAAVGSYRPEALEAATLSPEEADVLWERLRAQGIKPEDYLI